MAGVVGCLFSGMLARLSLCHYHYVGSHLGGSRLIGVLFWKHFGALTFKSGIRGGDVWGDLCSVLGVLWE